MFHAPTIYSVFKQQQKEVADWLLIKACRFMTVAM